MLEKLLPGLYSGIRTAKYFWSQYNVAVTAGGSTTPILASGTSVVGPNIYTGSGAPTVTAPKGSLYLRTDGSSTSTRLYVNTDGATTWTSCTTAA